MRAELHRRLQCRCRRCRPPAWRQAAQSAPVKFAAFVSSPSRAEPARLAAALGFSGPSTLVPHSCPPSRAANALEGASKRVHAARFGARGPGRGVARASRLWGSTRADRSVGLSERVGATSRALPSCRRCPPPPAALRRMPTRLLPLLHPLQPRACWRLWAAADTVQWCTLPCRPRALRYLRRRSRS